MLKVIDKDILTVTGGIICHQVNCMARMGSGIALAIKTKWPVVYEEYYKYAMKYAGEEESLLGDALIIPVSEHIGVANVFGQQGYGRAKICYTNYPAVEKAFNALKRAVGEKQVYIPYLMGCGLAGGNWVKYEKIIEDCIPNAIVCKLPGMK